MINHDNEKVQRFWGSDGDDRIQGTEVADVMRGKAGEDIYTINNKNDVVIEKYNEGIDTFKTFISVKIPLNVEKVFVIGEPWEYGYHSNILGNVQNNYVTGNCGHNFIDGRTGNDTLFGGRGGDIIHGGTGNDQVGGGLGNDILYDINGNDTYFYNLNEGQDVVFDYAGKDRIVFGSDIDKGDLVFYRDGSDLIIDVNNYNDKLIIDNYFKPTAHGYHKYAIESFNFSDGDTYGFDDVSRMASFHNNPYSETVQSNSDNPVESLVPVVQSVNTGFHFGNMFGLNN